VTTVQCDFSDRECHDAKMVRNVRFGREATTGAKSRSPSSDCVTLCHGTTK
jgi:hypothetical protein